MFNIKKMFGSLFVNSKEKVTNKNKILLQKTLNDLGNSVEEIANSLRQLGIKGQSGSSVNCPISNYLKAKSFRLNSVGVTHILIYDLFNDTFNNFRVEMPDIIRNFIKRFDRGEFIDLVYFEGKM